jgi:RNA-binding protein PNO1
MVVTHIPMEGLEGPVSVSEKTKKNRRRVTRKKTDSIQPVPSSHPDKDDEDMIEAHSPHEADQTLPEGKDGTNDDADELMIDANIASISQNMSAAPVFAPADPSVDKTTMKSETRRVPIPPHRMTPLKKDWLNIFGPLTEILGLQVRMNVQRRCVEIRVFGSLSVQPEAKFDVKC